MKNEAEYLLVKDTAGEFLYSLDKDQTIVADGPVGESVIVIENKTARFEHSDCQNGLCVLMGAISKGGEWAACLPNKVFISIEGGHDEEAPDSLSF